MGSIRSYSARFLSVIAALIIGFGASSAQPYTYVPTNTDEAYTGYYYLYDGNNYIYNNSYMMWYDYYSPNYNEWIITAEDMKNAGLCPGPIDAMGLKFVSNIASQTARIRIFVRPIPSWQYTLTPFPEGTNWNYPDYYMYAAEGFGDGNVRPGYNSVEVHDDPNFVLPVIGQNDTTFVNFEFNKSTFVWDGESNLVFGMERCNVGANWTFNLEGGMLWEVTRPPDGEGYFWPFHSHHKGFTIGKINVRVIRGHITTGTTTSTPTSSPTGNGIQRKFVRQCNCAFLRA